MRTACATQTSGAPLESSRCRMLTTFMAALSWHLLFHTVPVSPFAFLGKLLALAGSASSAPGLPELPAAPIPGEERQRRKLCCEDKSSCPQKYNQLYTSSRRPCPQLGHAWGSRGTPVAGAHLAFTLRWGGRW